MRTLTLAVGAAALLGISAPLASAAPAVNPLAPGTHVPAPLGPNSCSSIPDDYDAAVAKQVHDIASGRGVDAKVMLATFETAWVESHVNNLDCGDADSVGVFQQRPSQGWGTVEECEDVNHATNAFLDQAIPNDANNPGWTAGQVSQSVQRSAYPDRYDESEGKANEIISASQ